jgi:phosphopantetheinyl transferase
LPATRLGAPIHFARAAGAPRGGAALLRRLAAAALPGAGDRLQVERRPLGRPVIRLADGREISASLSTGPGALHAALALQGRVGIDAAGAAEFAAPYPLARVFGPQEWRLARIACGGRARAAALLWCAKEACVKALGCGFHRLDPRAVACSDLEPCGPGLRLHFAPPLAMAVFAREGREGEWLSIAWSGERHGER